MLGAFVNASAAIGRSQREAASRDRVLGKLGGLSLEDAAFAGYLAMRLRERGARIEGEAASVACALAPEDAAAVRALVQGASHGRYLRSLGGFFARDVEAAAS